MKRQALIDFLRSEAAPFTIRVILTERDIVGRETTYLRRVDSFGHGARYAFHFAQSRRFNPIGVRVVEWIWAMTKNK